MKYHVKNPQLAAEGKRRIAWADRDMPVLQAIRERFTKEKPFAGIRMGLCLHVTTETANLARTLQAGGADVSLCASNPLSTQDDTAAALVKHYGIATYAVKGEKTETYYKHLNAVLDTDPQVTMDDGADLISLIHKARRKLAKTILGSMEETTTGVIRLKALEKSGKLKIPIIAVNDAATKHLFDNRYGTGQSTVDGIVRATDVLLAGKNVVCAGYGWCGKGFAMRARGMGAKIVVTEVDPIKAIEAVMDGFSVMPMAAAARIGEVFCTLTGDVDVIRKEHFALMPDGAIVCNSGHFDVEINLKDLEKMASQVRRGVREQVDEFTLKDGRRIYVIAEGRLVNLAAAHGHPASVMDMSFATQALAAEYVVKSGGKLLPQVYNVPAEIEETVSTLKLRSMGVK
ncbi:MAG: adenosylhomocysteinase, partial [Patescibacteria group bacterium]|nr:adenosylhomocysteinase [Patescibacteria group bacterium]